MNESNEDFERAYRLKNHDIEVERSILEKLEEDLKETKISIWSWLRRRHENR